MTGEEMETARSLPGYGECPLASAGSEPSAQRRGHHEDSVGRSGPDEHDGRSIYVEQWRYGHPARKASFLYAVGIDFSAFPLNSEKSRAIVPQWMIDRYGEAKARKIGVVAMMGGKDKVKNRNATPPRFRDVLIAMAETARPYALRRAA